MPGAAADSRADESSVQREFERLDGELDAALVFASAAEYHRQNEDPEMAATCLSDATRMYAEVLTAFRTVDFSGAQMHELRAKLIRLEERLRELRTPRRNEAA